MTSDYTQFQYRDEHGCRMSACINIVAFTDARLADGPHLGMLNFYNAFLKRFGTEIKWYRTNTDDRFKKTSPAKLDMVPFWFSDERSKNDNPLGVALKAGDSAKDMQVPSFKFICSQSRDYAEGFFYMMLPIGNGFESLEKMLPLVQEALAEFPLVSGYAGYTVFWDVLDFRFEKAVFNQVVPQLHMRHPGLGFNDPDYLSQMAVQEGLTGVDWLTFLGPKHLAQMGGIEALQAKLPAPAKVLPLACQGGGAIVVACDHPQVGDLEKGDNVAPYQQVGHALRELRSKHHFYASGFGDEESNIWFNRFFGND